MMIVSNIEIKLPKCPVYLFCRRWIAFICYIYMTTRVFVLFLVTRDQISIDRESKNRIEYLAIKTDLQQVEPSTELMSTGIEFTYYILT